MSQTLTLDLPRDLWWTSNELLGMHYHTAGKKARGVRKAASDLADDTTFIRVNRCRVTVTASIPTARRFDPANIAGTVSKHALDGFTDAGLWPDDDSEHVIFVGFQRGPKTGIRGLYRLTFEIEAL
jgi:crossover junction endodeoxyribonuclease RusA